MIFSRFRLLWWLVLVSLIVTIIVLQLQLPQMLLLLLAMATAITLVMVVVVSIGLVILEPGASDTARRGTAADGANLTHVNKLTEDTIGNVCRQRRVLAQVLQDERLRLIGLALDTGPIALLLLLLFVLKASRHLTFALRLIVIVRTSAIANVVARRRRLIVGLHVISAPTLSACMQPAPVVRIETGVPIVCRRRAAMIEASATAAAAAPAQYGPEGLAEHRLGRWASRVGRR